MDSLKEVLLTSIDKTLDSQEFYNGLDNSHWKDWTEQQKFDWAFKLYKATVGRYESEGGKIVKFLSVSFVALCSMQSSSKSVAVFDLGILINLLH